MEVAMQTNTRAIAPRHDLYRFIHKGLRGYLCETLIAVGRIDPADRNDMNCVLGELRGLLALCRGHLEHENAFIHPALERALAGAAAETSAEHERHRQEIAALGEAARRLEDGAVEDRGEAAHRLYLQLSRFVAENLAHMLQEEEENNALLWRSYEDAALRGIEQAIVAKLSPEQMAVALRWMVPAMTPAERAGFIGELRRALPAGPMKQILDLVRPHLTGGEWRKLAAIIPVNDDEDQPGVSQQRAR
jgi:hypothetical protein